MNLVVTVLRIVLPLIASLWIFLSFTRIDITFDTLGTYFISTSHEPELRLLGDDNSTFLGRPRLIYTLDYLGKRDLEREAVVFSRAAYYFPDRNTGKINPEKDPSHTPWLATKQKLLFKGGSSSIVQVDGKTVQTPYPNRVLAEGYANLIYKIPNVEEAIKRYKSVSEIYNATQVVFVPVYIESIIWIKGDLPSEWYRVQVGFFNVAEGLSPFYSKQKNANIIFDDHEIKVRDANFYLSDAYSKLPDNMSLTRDLKDRNSFTLVGEVKRSFFISPEDMATVENATFADSKGWSVTDLQQLTAQMRKEIGM